MAHPKFTRREFSRALSRFVALAVAWPGLPSELDAQTRNRIPDDTIRLNFNENPYGPSPKARAALAACTEIASRYPDEAILALKKVIATKSGVAPENVVLGCGSTEILRGVDAAFLGSAKHVVAADPTFEAVLEYARVMHSSPVKIPLTRDYRHDVAKMAAACSSKTGVLYLCNPNNPTGTIVTRDEMAAGIRVVPPSTLILVDEAYGEFACDPEYGSAIEFIPKYSNVVVTRTFSKIYGLAGMRLGYAIGAREQIARISAQLVQDNGNAAVLAAALAGLGDQQNIASCRDRLIASRKWLADALTGEARAFIPSHANFVMIDMGSDAGPFIEQFKARKIFVGRRFASMPNFLRISIGTESETEAFLVALRQIAPAPASKTT